VIKSGETITAFFYFMNPETKKHLNDILRILAHTATLGAAMVFSTFAGVWFGYWLDTDIFHGKTHPWLTIIFFLFGLAGGIRNLFLMTNRLKRKTDKWEKEEREEIPKPNTKKATTPKPLEWDED